MANFLQAQGAANTAIAPKPLLRPADIRPDGSRKDVGFLGKLMLPGGGVATEYSVGVPIGGKEMDIPTLVPTLTKQEVELMRTDIIPNGKKIPMEIVRKASEHARMRIAAGRSPFYQTGEGKL